MNDQGGRKSFIRHLHCFRGFAALNIVAVHAWSGQVIVAGGPGTSTGYAVLNAVNETLFHDSTLYFAVLSGLLFSLVLKSRGWRLFFQRKLLNVISPYIVMTCLFTWYGLREDDRLAFFAGSLTDYLVAVAGNLPYGGAMFQLWYVPIFVLLCLATPLIAWLLTQARMRWLIWLIMLAPLAVSRTWPDFSWSTPIYFLGAYTVGMFVGERYERALAAFHRYRTPLVLTALFTTPCLIAAYLLELDAPGPVSLRETLFYMQKLSIAALVLVWFRAIEARLPRWLDALSTYAFAIFFLHATLLVMLQEIQLGLASGPIPALAAALAGLLCFILAVATAFAISAFAKRVMGDRSRMVLGA